MAYEQKAGTGTAWKNDKYVAGGNQPYAKGKIIDLNGNLLDIAIWMPKSEKVNGFNVTLSQPYNNAQAGVNELIAPLLRTVDGSLYKNNNSNNDLPF